MKKMKKKYIIVLIILFIILFLWFIPVVRITIWGSCGTVYDPITHSNASCHNNSYSYITLKNFLFSNKVGY